MIFYPNRSFCFEKYFIFSWSQLPRNAKAILAKFWVTSKNVNLVIFLRFYNALRRSGNQKARQKLSKILQQPPIRHPRSSLEIVQTTATCSPCLIQSAQISTFQVSRQAALSSRYEIFHISMLISALYKIYGSSTFQCFQVRPFLAKN